MKKLIVFLSLGILSQGLEARVTPAPLALEKVRNYLEGQIERAAYDVIPHHKAASYIVESEVSFGRGKYSEDHFGFADISGRSRFTFQLGLSDTFYEVECYVNTRVEVVGFAKQMVPILEETTNEEQLVLKKHRIDCERVR